MVINPGLGGSCGTSLYQLTPPLFPTILSPLTPTAARQQQLQNLFVKLRVQDRTRGDDLTPSLSIIPLTTG